MDDYGYFNDTIGEMKVMTSLSNNEVETEYCGQEFQTFNKNLKAVKGVVTAVTCPIGILTNIVNIVVLTNKNMSRSAINAILTSIAVADLLFLVSTLIFNLIHYDGLIHMDICVKHSYAVQLLLLVSSWTSQTASRVSIMLTFVLAVWRYIAVTFPLKAQILCSFDRAIVAIVISYILVPVTTIVLYLSGKVSPVDGIGEENGSLMYVVGARPSTGHCSSLFDILPTEWNMSSDGIFMYVGFWVYALLYKILLPMAVIVISVILVRSLQVSSRRHLQLAQRLSTTDRSCLRTTRMLLAILIMFIVAEVPRGILLMLNVPLGREFHDNCFRPLSEVMELLDILNSTLNFVLYYTMSTQFRITFLGLFTSFIYTRTGSVAPSPQCTTHF